MWLIATPVAKAINRALADGDGPIRPLIAETGGLNAMIVDSSALPEQVCDAVIGSAFRSAGQRCSALRVLCLHESIADAIKRQLKRIKNKQSSTKASLLYLTILNETKTMVLQARNLVKSQRYFLEHKTE